LPGLLTKKFINLLQGAENGTLDLNKAAEMLEVWYFALSSGS
jgi:transcription factor E2F3